MNAQLQPGNAGRVWYYCAHMRIEHTHREWRQERIPHIASRTGG